MFTRLLCAVLPLVLACTFGLQLAHADIYTWVDASGKVNISNLPPPEGVRVTSVKHDIPPKVAMRPDTGADAARLAEVQALSERVQQLENEIEVARRQAPPMMEYRPVPAPPVMQYPAMPPPQPVQYAVEPAPPAAPGCDPAWFNCGLWWNSGIYPATVIVVRPLNFRRGNPVHGGHRLPSGHNPPGGQHPPMQKPMHVAVGNHRR